jgi:hypothetical protein
MRFVYTEVAMLRISLFLIVVPTVFFGLIAPTAAQHPPSGPQRRDRPSGQFVNSNGQFRWVSPIMLALTPAPRPSAMSNPGPYASGAKLDFLRGGRNSYARSRSPRLRRSPRGIRHAPPAVRPGQFLHPRGFQPPPAPQRNEAPPLFRPRP